MTVVPFPSYGARRSDPPTSHKAARINQRYRNTQRFLMLLAHAQVGERDEDYDGLTADECAIAANFPVPCNGGTSKSCYWKRHSELWRDWGYLEPVYTRWGIPLERKLIHVPHSEPQQVLIITLDGLEHVEEVIRSFP